MSLAAVLAGLAFSNTKTALAHSISYPISLKHGVAHGIACSFPLPLVLRRAIGVDPDCDNTLRAIFGEDLAIGADNLERFLADLGVSTQPDDYGLSEVEFSESLKVAQQGERGKNFIAA
jgi:alcohol dehydrogenase